MDHLTERIKKNEELTKKQYSTCFNGLVLVIEKLNDLQIRTINFHSSFEDLLLIIDSSIDILDILYKYYFIYEKFDHISEIGKTMNILDSLSGNLVKEQRDYIDSKIINKTLSDIRYQIIYKLSVNSVLVEILKISKIILKRSTRDSNYL